MQVLGRLGPHARSEAGCEDDCRQAQSWGARIRTWDRGTKTRCLTTWLRPTAVHVPPKARVNAAARAKPARPLSRRCEQRLSTWLRPTAVGVPPKARINTAARAKPARPRSRCCKQHLSTWLRPTASPRALAPTHKV